jgi:zinc transporter
LLQQPHRHAYMQDLQSELEIAQRGIYRLEGRVDDLFQDLAAASNDRVEKRLRVLTIVSAITLPLGLLTGLLGMNVGGIPGTDQRYGFWWVLLLMGVVSAALLLFFRRRGWFE